MTRHRHGRADGEPVQRGLEPALGEHGGMDAAGELAQLGEPGFSSLDRAVEQRRGPRAGSAR